MKKTKKISTNITLSVPEAFKKILDNLDALKKQGIDVDNIVLLTKYIKQEYGNSKTKS